MIFRRLTTITITACWMLLLAACGSDSGETITKTNTAPQFTSITDVAIAENTTNIFYTATATDTDGDAIIYTLSGGADQSLFILNNQSGELRYVTPPDFENPTDVDKNNIYLVEVQADDSNGGIVIQPLMIVVSDVVENPSNTAPTFTSTNSASILENSTGTIYTAVATDIDDDTVNYLLSGDDQAQFTLDISNGNLIFVITPDYENPQDNTADNIYDIIITAVDGNGGSTPLPIAISVTDVAETPPNQAPAFTSVNTISIAENTTGTFYTSVATDADGDTVSYSVTGGEDATDFNLNSTNGQLAFIIAADFENPIDANMDNIYHLVITANDGKNGSTDLSLTISVTDVVEALPNSPPQFTSSNAVSVKENTVIAYTATISDVDGDIPSFSLSGGLDQFKFNIDTATGELHFVTAPDFENPTDSNTDNLYWVNINADDGNGGVTTLDVSVQITDQSLLSLEISYPTVNASFAYQSSEITVSGILSDNEDGVVQTSDVADINVNGTSATLDANDPSHWSVLVPVDKSAITLQVNVVSTSGETDTANRNVDNNPLLFAATDIILDKTNNRALLGDEGLDAIIALDLTTGARTVISSPTIGSGSGIGSFASPAALALDTINNTLYVMDGGRTTLFSVAPSTGNRTIVSSSTVGAGPTFSFNAIGGIALDLAKNRVLVTDQRLGGIAAIDLTTGDRTIISDANIGTGTTFSNPRNIIKDVGSDRVFINDLNLNTIFSVDLTNGNRTVLASISVGAGHNVNNTLDIEHDPANNRLIASVGINQESAVLAIDIASGDRTILSDIAVGTGLNFTSPVRIALDSISNTIMLLDRDLDLIMKVDLTNGNRQVISTSNIGTGPTFKYFPKIKLDRLNNRLLVSNSTELLAVDLASGDRSEISGNTRGSGYPLSAVGGLTLDSVNNRAYLVDQGFLVKALISIDLSTGNRTIVSGGSTTTGGIVGAGAALGIPVDVTLDISNNRVLVVDSSLTDLIIAIDLNTGNRTVLSSNTVGTGVLFNNPQSIVMDVANNRALVLDTALGSLLTVDLSNGNRTALPGSLTFAEAVAIDDTDPSRAIVAKITSSSVNAVDLVSGAVTELSSDFNNDSGPTIGRASGIAYDAKHNRAFVTDSQNASIIVIELGSGQRAIASK